MEKTLLKEDIPEVSVLLVPHTYPLNEEQDRSAADKYCACESCKVTVGELQNALREVVKVFPANASHAEMEEAQNFE